MPKNAKNSVYKEKEFEMYILWKSAPAYFRGMKKEQLISHGFSDPIIHKIIKIKSQTEFAKTFNIKDLGTLTDWNKKIEQSNLPTKNIGNVFNEQMDVVHNKIALQPDILLKNKIKEQRRLIIALKKEINLQKKQLKKHARQKTKTTPLPVSRTVPIIQPTIQPIVQPITPPPDTSSFLQAAKNFFKKWGK